MRRKSERNKGKTSPEKKVEKPTRKSTRRRAKKSPSTSPERENSNDGDGITTEKESSNTYKIQTRLQSKETIENIVEEPEAKVSSTDQLNDDIDDGGSVWKVARADASPGTIQKLKLCRQRNLSETSDISLGRKRISKRQEGSEGVAEEADSADERPAASNDKAYVGTLPLAEDTSSTTLGRESGEEVSDSKEIPPETTTVDLSDVKPNIDQQPPQQPETTEQSIPRIDEDNDDHRRDDGDGKDDDRQDDNSVSAQGTVEPDEIEKPAEKSAVESRTTPRVEEPDDSAVENNTSNQMEIADSVEKEQPHDPKRSRITESVVEEEAPKSATSDDDEKLKTHKTAEVNSSDNSNDESLKRTTRTSRSTRRKHRDKYRDSSNSDTAESEEDTERSAADNQEKHVERKATREESPPSKGGSSELEESNKQHDVPDDESKKDKTVASVAQNDKETFGTTGSYANTYRPAKVNLKRSFTSRVSVDESKREDADSANDAGQNKENHIADESKCIPKRRRWGTALSTDTAPVLSISTESLKALVPGAKPLSLNEVRLSKDDEDDRDRHREKRHTANDGDKLKENLDTKSDNLKDNHMAARRKISIVKEAPQLKSPSPPVAQPTNILLIKNLVRPFTLNQIKELLSRTGTIVENGFWMDRIKSKCFVEYSNEDQAFETRQALHGISWPMSNPKKLQVEYATKEDMEKAKESSKDQPLSRKAEAMSGADPWQQEWGRDEKSNSTTKVTVVREWDLGKEDGQHLLKDKEREKKDIDKKRRQRSRSPTLEAHLPAPARKFKKKEDEPPPAKLLDDLFRKTKATPCIYWLPLTNEQIVVKEEMRRQHMAEHARRLEEMRRAERNRDSRRRRSPRK